MEGTSLVVICAPLRSCGVRGELVEVIDRMAVPCRVFSQPDRRLTSTNIRAQYGWYHEEALVPGREETFFHVLSIQQTKKSKIVREVYPRSNPLIRNPKNRENQIRRYQIMVRIARHSFFLIALALAAASVVSGFQSSSSSVPFRSKNSFLHSSITSIDTSNPDIDFTMYEGRKPSEDWELDCYSRPVITAGGKKLWEVLITDSTGSFRFCKTLPSNQVNSKVLRQTVEDLMEDPNIDTKPSTIRFFRGAMFNMVNIALSELDVVGRPSRCTNSIAGWLEERHRDVYPNMEG